MAENKAPKPTEEDEVTTSVASPWLTKQRAADYLNVHPETIRRLANKGLITRHGTGKLARYRQTDLDRYLMEHRN